MKHPKKPNVLLLGASGGVAMTFLHHLTEYRSLFGKLILVDRHPGVRKNPYVDHKILKYRFLRFDVDPVRGRGRFITMLKKHGAHIVIDATDCDTIPLIEAVDAAGASYLGTAINSETRTIPDTVDEVWRTKRSFRGAPHIVCSGMNPGVVNAWARHGIGIHGKPSEIVHFEYDTSQMIDRWRPMVTWSVKEFLEEAVLEKGGLVLGRYRQRELKPNSLVHRKNMHAILKPILPLVNYPEGFCMFHEECSSLSNMYDVPSRFIYAIHPRTMAKMIDLYDRKGTVDKEDLVIGDNEETVLDGSDTIGVRLEYPKKVVYYVNSFPNTNTIGSNATYTQVVIGLFAGLFTLLKGGLKDGVHFPEDLDRTYYKDFIFDNMRVQEFTFRKRGGRLRLQRYVPRVTLRGVNHLNHRYII